MRSFPHADYFTQTGKGEIKIHSDHSTAIPGVIQYCYSGKYPEVQDTIELPPIIWHAGFWDFAVEYEMLELNSVARQQFEKAAGQEIATPQFAKFLREVLLRERPNARESCLSIIGKYAGEIFSGSEKYGELCKVIKGDNQFLFELTTHLATHKTERAPIVPQKRINPKQETLAANKLQKTSREDAKRGAEHPQVTGSKLLDQAATLRPEDVQCCMLDWSEQTVRKKGPTTPQSAAQDLLDANGFVRFHCPGCRSHFDAKIAPREKFRHGCKRDGSEHTGAVWHAFFRSGKSNKLSVEREWWIIFRRMQNVLADHKVN